MSPLHVQYPFRSIIRSWLTVAAVLLMVGFIAFQARFLIIGPTITLNPLPPGPYNEPTIALSGQTANISRLWLNDRPIFTNAKGEFNELLVLEAGYTTATIEAEDRYGRTTNVTVPLVYVPASFYPPLSGEALDDPSDITDNE